MPSRLKDTEYFLGITRPKQDPGLENRLCEVETSTFSPEPGGLSRKVSVE